MHGELLKARRGVVGRRRCGADRNDVPAIVVSGFVLQNHVVHRDVDDRATADPSSGQQRRWGYLCRDGSRQRVLKTCERGDRSQSHNESNRPFAEVFWMHHRLRPADRGEEFSACRYSIVRDISHGKSAESDI